MIGHGHVLASCNDMYELRSRRGRTGLHDTPQIRSIGSLLLDLFTSRINDLRRSDYSYVSCVHGGTAEEQ